MKKDLSEYTDVLPGLKKMYEQPEEKKKAPAPIPQQVYRSVQDLSGVELETIRILTPGKAEKISFPDEEELSLIQSVRAGRKRNFKQFLWGFSANGI